MTIPLIAIVAVGAVVLVLLLLAGRNDTVWNHQYWWQQYQWRIRREEVSSDERDA